MSEQQLGESTRDLLDHRRDHEEQSPRGQGQEYVHHGGIKGQRGGEENNIICTHLEQRSEQRNELLSSEHTQKEAVPLESKENLQANLRCSILGTIHLCGTLTVLGGPVVPDVWRTYASSGRPESFGRVLARGSEPPAL